jgi:hypothetical protein
MRKDGKRNKRTHKNRHLGKGQISEEIVNLPQVINYALGVFVESSHNKTLLFIIFSVYQVAKL